MKTKETLVPDESDVEAIGGNLLKGQTCDLDQQDISEKETPKTTEENSVP